MSGWVLTCMRRMSGVCTKPGAPATIVAAGGGSEATQVPDDLHNYLHARVDANGQVRILETDGQTAPSEEANHD